MTMIYYEEDGDLNILAGKLVGVIGYQRMGRPLALNLRDSGVDVVIGGDLVDQERARADAFEAASVAEAADRAQIILMALPDELMTAIYMRDISPNLKRGDTLIFVSAYNVAFGLIEPPPFVDVVLVAPRAGGDVLRARFESGEGFLSFVAVWQDASRAAWQVTLAVALAVGSLRAGAFEVSIQQEAELTLFVQQAVIPAFHHIALTAASLMMEQGYPPEAVLLDVYLNGKFSDYIAEAGRVGLLGALGALDKTNQYGAFSRMDRFSELKLERLMEVTLEEIRGGDFAREWVQEFTDGHPRLNKLRKQQESLDLWDMEQQALDMLHPDEPDIY